MDTKFNQCDNFFIYDAWQNIIATSYLPINYCKDDLSCMQETIEPLSLDSNHKR